jgi:hypothetical protein
MDVTELIDKSTVLHNGADPAHIRWRYDRYFRRDGRHIGSCNWFTVASDWCIELWKPLDDLTMDEAIANIHPIQAELLTVIEPAHLIDDYVLSRNIAQFGLKFATLQGILNSTGQGDANFLWHQYTVPAKEKLAQMREVLARWRLNG